MTTQRLHMTYINHWMIPTVCKKHNYTLNVMTHRRNVKKLINRKQKMWNDFRFLRSIFWHYFDTHSWFQIPGNVQQPIKNESNNETFNIHILFALFDFDLSRTFCNKQGRFSILYSSIIFNNSIDFYLFIFWILYSLLSN